jgi:site-specific recombinase XerD
MAYVLVSLPIRQKLDEFKKHLLENEYHTSTIISYQTYASKFLRSDYFNEKDANIKDQINMFLKNESNIAPKTIKDRRAALYAYYRSLIGKAYPKSENKSDISEIEVLFIGFQEFEKRIKHLTDISIYSDIAHMRRFLTYTYQQSEQFDVSTICAIDIRNYFTGEISHLRPGTKGRIATSIRSFFNYLQFSGADIDKSIFKLPLSPAVWKLNSVPTVLADDEFKALHNSFDKNRAAGIRDYAITLCFTELGLRCAEVARLSLDDFDWIHSIIKIKGTKTHTDRILPISSTFGKAIIDYLKHSRPTSKNRVLFVRFSHVIGDPMGSSQIRGVMRRAYKRAGISETITGTHILRRTVASKIYKKGASLKMVADVLGHQILDSTSAYTKIDTERLLQAAGKWPGGGSYD